MFPRSTWIALIKTASQQGGWPVECDPQTKDLKAAKSIRQPTRSKERWLEMSTNWRQRVGLGTHPGRGEQGEQALLYLVPSLSITTVWRRCDSCRVPFAWTDTPSICPVIRLHLHGEHGGEALLVFWPKQAETSSWLDVLSLRNTFGLHWTPQKRTPGFGGQFPHRPEAHLLSRGKAPHDTNEEKRMDLCIDYGRQSVLPGCFMKSIYQYQTGDKS